MNKKMLPMFFICCLTLAVTGYSDTTENANASENDTYTAKAAGLIDLYSLGCSGDIQTLYITASTKGNEKMSEIGLKNIRIEKSSDKVNWTTERTLSDMTLESESVYNISKQEVSVEGDCYYRVTLEHYAKEDTRWFPQEQTVENTSFVVYVPAEDPHNQIYLTKSILSEDVVFDDGTVIPEGTTAFAINIEDNQGFSIFKFDLNIGSAYDIITDSENRPVFTKYHAVNYNSMITSSVNNENVVFSLLCSHDCLVEGEILTFYAIENPDSDEKDYSVKSRTIYSTDQWHEYGSGAAYLAAGCPLIYYGKDLSPAPPDDKSIYIVGDIDGNMTLDLADAFKAYYAINSSWVGIFSDVKVFHDYCFPNITDVRAAYIWNRYDDSDDDMQHFSDDVALELLKYFTDTSAGKDFITDSYIGEIRHIG